MPPHREGMDYANGGIVIENMVIAATDLGIDSCIMRAPIAALAENADLSSLIGIPDGFTPVLYRRSIPRKRLWFPNDERMGAFDEVYGI